MLLATHNITPPMHASGTSSSHCVANNTKPNLYAAWKYPASGVIAPALMLVAVRASAPVQGKPLIIGTRICTMPCPQNSRSGSNGVFLFPAILSAIVEQSKLSTPETKTTPMTK